MRLTKKGNPEYHHQTCDDCGAEFEFTWHEMKFRGVRPRYGLMESLYTLRCPCCFKKQEIVFVDKKRCKNGNTR